MPEYTVRFHPNGMVTVSGIDLPDLTTNASFALAVVRALDYYKYVQELLHHMADNKQRDFMLSVVDQAISEGMAASDLIAAFDMPNKSFEPADVVKTAASDGEVFHCPV